MSKQSVELKKIRLSARMIARNDFTNTFSAVIVFAFDVRVLSTVLVPCCS